MKQGRKNARFATSNRRRPGHTRGGIKVGRIDFVRAHSRHPFSIASEEQNPRDIIPIRSIFFVCGVHVCHGLPNVPRAALGGYGGSLQWVALVALCNQSPKLTGWLLVIIDIDHQELLAELCNLFVFSNLGPESLACAAPGFVNNQHCDALLTGTPAISVLVKFHPSNVLAPATSHRAVFALSIFLTRNTGAVVLRRYGPCRLESRIIKLLLCGAAK